MHAGPTTTELLSDKDTFRIWNDVCSNIPTLRLKTAKAKGNWLEKKVFNSLCGIGFRTLAGRVRELRGLSAATYENDVLVFKPGLLNRLLVVECKFRRQGLLIEKDRVMLFLQRIQDISNYFLSRGHQKYMLPMFVSSVPLDRNAFRFCLTYGILALQPNIEETTVYSEMVSHRPPLGALRYELAKPNVRDDAGLVKRLIRDIDHLHIKTVKYADLTCPKTEVIDGNKLEKAYFDILYRYKYVVKRGG
jgi:hypothetical protein